MKMMIRRIALACACLFTAVAGRAADGSWTNLAGGAWSVAANWQGGTVASGAGSAGYFLDLGGPVLITNDVAALKLQGMVLYGGAYTLYGQSVTFEGATAVPYGLCVSNGAHTVSSTIGVNRNIQVLTESGAALTTTGLFDYLGNYTVVKKGAGEWIFAGTCYETNANAYLDVVGGTLRLAPGAILTKRGGNRENFRVGYNGTAGRVVVGSGAALNVAGFVLGHDTAAATGYMLVDGGTLSADTTDTGNPILIGRYATGTLCLSNSASADIANWLDVGVYTRGEIFLGGSSSLTAGRLSLGWKDGVASHNGPGVIVVGSGQFSVINQFVWGASSATARTNLFSVGNGLPGSASLSLPATMEASGNTAFARLVLNGGTLQLAGVRNTTFGESGTNYLKGLDQLWVGRAGATIDTGTNTAVITQVLERDPSVPYDGGITKMGLGSLMLAGGKTCNGPTLVVEGTLALGGVLPAHALAVRAGATLSLADGQYRTFSPSSLAMGQDGESGLVIEVGAGNACDQVALPAEAALGSVRFYPVNSAGARNALVGDFAVVTYTGSAPDVGAWTADTPEGISATFEVQDALKRVVLHLAATATGRSVWISPSGGAWETASNWNTAPVGAPTTQVLLGDAIGSSAQVSLGSPVTVGTVTLDAPFAYTLAGSALTFGDLATAGALDVLQGSHALRTQLVAPTNLTASVAPGATVLVGGGVTGAGRLIATGGGTLAVTNGPAVDVPLTLDGAVLAVPASTTLDTALTVGADGATVLPSYGQTLTFSGAVDGPGALTKSGASIAVMSGANGGTGSRIVRNGTLTLSSLTDGGDLVIGEGTLKYVGPDVATPKGFVIQTSDAKLGAAFESDADVTFNGNVTTASGVFQKYGKGTLTFAASGVNTIGAGLGSDNYSVVLNRGAYGESPTQGLRIFMVLNGKVVLGVPGQTNIMSNTIVVGGRTTTTGTETAGNLEINDGFFQCGIITISRGNGTATTAPTGLVSTVRLNGGVVQSAGLYMGLLLGDMAAGSCNARPLFEMNGGVLTGGQLWLGNAATPVRPRLVFNGGFAAFTGGSSSDLRLAYDGGVTSETVIAGATVACSNALIRIADASAAAKAVLRLNGGNLITRGFERLGSGVGELYFNGGRLTPCQSFALTNLTASVVQAGGLVADVAQGMTLTLNQTLTHDAALGGTPDGGLVKLGAGTLAINNDQSYTGPTIISGGVLRVRGTLAVTNLTLSGGTTLSLTNGVHQFFAPSSLAAGDDSAPARIELDVAADGSAYDAVALPNGAGVKLTLALFRTGTALRFSRPGRYPLVTFGGSAPDTSSWSVEDSAGTASFETEGSTVYVRVGTASANVSVWTNAVGGAWATAGNWSEAPADDASATVLFGSAISAPAVISTGSGVTFGYLSADNASAYTWSGGAMTLGSAESNATVHVAQGAHVADADWSVPSAATVLADAGTALTLNGAVTGSGSLLVKGGGTVAITNGPALDVPITVSGATLAMPQSTEYDAAFTIGSGGAVFAPAYGATVTVWSGLTGPGGLTKTGSSFLTLAGGASLAGELMVRNGTVSMTNEPQADLVVGEGTFRYTGEASTFARGYKLRTTAAAQAATIFSDADITFNGQVTAERGAFIKLGAGAFTYAYAGENVLSAGDNQGTGSTFLNVQPYGDTPSQGYRSYSIYNGKVILGATGQTNRFSQAVIIGGQSTTNADAETAGHMEINGGVNIFQDYITVGRGNGTAVTAPTGLVSTLTVNGGETTANGFWMGAMLGNETTLTARPRFTLNDGTLSTTLFYGGGNGGSARPRIVINGGALNVGPNDAMRLAYCAGCEGELILNGGVVTLTNQPLWLAESASGAKGTLFLNGGRLAALNLTNGISGTGVVYFNGGVFQPMGSSTLCTPELTNQAGGAIFDVPAGVTYRLARAIVHDDALGASPDGGLTKLGEGSLVIDSTQAYTGPTVLSNGTLVAAAPAGSSLSAGALSLGGTEGPEPLLILTADRARFESSGAVTVYGDLFLGKTAVSLIVRETGTAPATNGVYLVATCTGSISGLASDLRLANGLFGKSYTFSVVGGELRLTVATAAAGVVWTNTGSGSWSEASNWATAPGAGSAGLAVGFMDAITAPATVSLDSPATAGSLLFNNANSYAVSGSGSLTLDETNGEPVVTAMLGTHTVAVPLALAEGATAAVTNGAELQFTRDVTGDAKLTKTGDGRLLLAGTNTYSGGTDVLKGYVDVSGSQALGAGAVTFNGGFLGSKGEGATVDNPVTVLSPMQVVTYSPLTLSGEWTSSGNIYLAKMSSNELTVTGSVKPASGSANRLDFREGSVRFASGADVLFTSTDTRECIDFRSPASTSISRALTVEPGANVVAKMLYVGYGATNTVTVNGGTLSLTGFSGSYYDAFIMGAAGTSSKVYDRFYVNGGTVTGADSAWWLMGVDKGKTLLDIAAGTVSLGAVSMGHRTENNIDSGLTAGSDVFVRGGLLEARQRWNWMGDTQGPRVNAVYLDGGVLRLPATFAGVTNKINQSRLIFNGGLLQTPGGGTDAEDPANYMNGLKQTYVGSGGAVIDTLGRNVGLSQRLMTLDAAADGGVTKLGLGTLTLAKPPCVTGRIDVQAGTLRMQSEPATAYPDDPMIRLSFEDGAQKDDSPYARTIGLVGSATNLEMIAGVNGTNALRMSGLNVLYAGYSADMANADSYTISAWVRQSAYQTDMTQHRTILGNLMGGNRPHEFLLRIESGAFRMLGTGAANYTYGTFTADVTNALPLNTWVMLTYVVDGLNGFSMYVNGERRPMKVTVNGTNVITSVYGAGSQWLMQPPLRTGGRAFMIGAVAEYDTAGFIGDLEDVTIYRRALSAPELAMLYRAKNPCAKRARVAMGAAMDLAGGGQELAELSGEGAVWNGTAQVAGTLNPGDAPESAAGALLTAENLVLGTNVTYRCDWAPAANDLVDVWGVLTVNGAGTVDLGLTSPNQMPGYPRLRSFPVMTYTSITGAANFSQWKVTGIGRPARASVSAADGVVAVNLEVFSGTLLIMR